MNEVTKRWIAAEELHEDSLRLALEVLDSGFAPTLVIGLWRGGSPVAIAVHEVLRYFGVHAEHVPLRTSLYSGIDRREAQLAILGLEVIAACGFDCSRVLLVDDVFDTGITLEQTLGALRTMPAMRGAELRTAALWWKPARNRSALSPDYWLHETEHWLVFPHELCGLDAAEIRNHKPGAAVLAPRLGRES